MEMARSTPVRDVLGSLETHSYYRWQRRKCTSGRKEGRTDRGPRGQRDTLYTKRGMHGTSSTSSDVRLMGALNTEHCPRSDSVYKMAIPALLHLQKVMAVEEPAADDHLATGSF